MTTYEATICGGRSHGQCLITKERNGWRVRGAGTARQTYRLVCQEDQRLLYVGSATQLPFLTKVVGREEQELLERICRGFRAQADKIIALPRPWRWAISTEPFGERRLLVRSRLTAQPHVNPVPERNEMCVEA